MIKTRFDKGYKLTRCEKKNYLFKIKDSMYRLTCIFLLLFSSCVHQKQAGTLIAVREDSGKGFHYPYFLFIPDSTPKNDKVYLIIEPNNSGFVSDELERHLEKAKRIATRDFYAGSYVAQKLHLPLLVPVFPRSESQWQIYTHALDRDVMVQTNTSLERLDLQLLAMVEDAGERLKEMGFNTSAQFFMTGFSASGTFVNRFAAIHPEKVKALAAGGVNGLLILPRAEINNEQLNYPIGTADFQVLFNKAFDFAAFKETPQFLFMGALDDNDAVPYADAFDPDEQELIFRTLGKEMQPMRWKNCQEIYEKDGINAQFKTYEDVGHEQPDGIKEDILEFFRSQKGL